MTASLFWINEAVLGLVFDFGEGANFLLGNKFKFISWCHYLSTSYIVHEND